MRTNDDVRRMLGLYEHLFALTDKKRAADQQSEQIAAGNRKDSDRKYQAGIKQADAMQRNANSEASRLGGDVSVLEKDVRTFAIAANFPDSVTLPQILATGTGTSVWNDILRHKRDAEVGYSALNANLERIRKTRSRWWWLLMFVR